MTLAHLVSPMKNIGMRGTFPFAIRDVGGGDVSQQLGSFHVSFGGTKSMLRELPKDSLGVGRLGVFPHKVLPGVSPQVVHESSKDKVLLLLEQGFLFRSVRV